MLGNVRLIQLSYALRARTPLLDGCKDAMARGGMCTQEPHWGTYCPAFNTESRRFYQAGSRRLGPSFA
eukprot:CAMPEP_0205903274 /NCGR_PEP_ID=MMETSP1083-20121108/28651_1 /ASSEMBLY_ACC=CAM_ASM_000430 /TAXON_ID=97485 /ORGANISM="Prymnesium parvum, Strain Texoma1" /LENGTH=67 /DNA_ID=CAMNT_0053268905 /DNA_START=781 /DNA_END=984 /DNA_ORIENTATION=-